jgi:hypothetical protein
MPDKEKKYYSKQGLWLLFLICAFPLHLWTLLLSFRDISWLAERTNFGDAMGVVSYGLIFAFLESLLVFLFALLCGMLIPIRWGKDKRLAITSMLVFTLALWAIFSQLYALQSWGVPDALIRFLAGSAHPLRYIYFISLVFIVPSALAPILTIYKSEKALKTIMDMIGNISLLTTFYLLLDLVALIIVIFRNL